jgi:hypothetical protein
VSTLMRLERGARAGTGRQEENGFFAFSGLGPVCCTRTGRPEKHPAGLLILIRDEADRMEVTGRRHSFTTMNQRINELA